jgi:hypothetical protein
MRFWFFFAHACELQMSGEPCKFGANCRFLDPTHKGYEQHKKAGYTHPPSNTAAPKASAAKASPPKAKPGLWCFLLRVFVLVTSFLMIARSCDQCALWV